LIYKAIQKGMKKRENLPKDRIECLEDIGFQWQGVRTACEKTFENHCFELISFKEEFGHCNVPVKYADNPSLGKWCSHM